MRCMMCEQPDKHSASAAPAYRWTSCLVPCVVVPEELVLLDRDQRRPFVIGGQDFEQHVNHGAVRLVEDGVIDVDRLKKELPRAIHDGLVRQHISHVAGCNLTNPRADMVVLADITTGLQRELGDT